MYTACWCCCAHLILNANPFLEENHDKNVHRVYSFNFDEHINSYKEQTCSAAITSCFSLNLRMCGNVHVS